MKKFLAKLEKLELKFDMIAPDHGLIWRKSIDGIMRSYQSWSGWETKPKAVIVYDTMWGSTAKMARAVAHGLSGDGVSVKLFDLRINHRSDIITEVLDARAVILGSSILNSGILPKMADMIAYMKGLRPMNKLGVAFGSYGWKDTIVKMLGEAMEEMKFEIVDPGISVQYVPTEDDLNRCAQMGEFVKKAVLGE